MKKSLLSLLILLFVAALQVLVATLQAADIRVGIPALGESAGVEMELWKPGCWTNVRIQPTADTPSFQQVRVIAPDSDGTAMACVVDRPNGTAVEGTVPDGTATEGTAAESPKETTADETTAACPEGATAPIEISVLPGRSQTSLRVEFLRDGQVVASETRSLENPISSDRSVVLVVGGDAGYFERASELLHIPGNKRPVFFRIADASQLPNDPRALDFVSTIVLATQDEQTLASWTVARLHLLEQWVQRGGFLVVTSGSHTPKLVQGDADAVAAWRAFLPGTFEKVVAMPQTTALEHYAQSITPVPLLGMSEEYRIPVARFQEISSEFRAELSQYDLPLIFHSVRDFGRITFVAFDLEHEALKRWSDTPNLLGNLLGFTSRASDYELKQVAGLHYGYDDMAGQLRSALDDFPAIRTVSFWTLSILLALYLATIGPGCFFLCRRVSRHGEVLSWGVFLLSVLVVCSLLYWLSRSPQPAERLNRIAVTDIATDTGHVRQSLWGTLWTSNSGRYTLALSPLNPQNSVSSGSTPNGSTPSDSVPSDSAPSSSAPSGNVPTNCTSSSSSCESSCLSWFGLPGPFLGGMDSNAAMVSTLQGTSSFCKVTPEAITDLPMSPRSTKCLTAKRWTSTTELFGEGTPNFGTLEDRAAIPYGVVRNPLDVPLEHVLLLYNGWAYDLQEIPAGGEVEINDTLRRYDMAAVLVDEQIIEEGISVRENQKATRRVVLKYNPASRDLEYILKSMLFYTSVGGRSYTGLENKYQFQTDITPILHSGKAVLYGRVQGASQNHGLFADFTLSQSSNSDAEQRANSTNSQSPVSSSTTAPSSPSPATPSLEGTNVQLLRVVLPVTLTDK